MLNLTTTTYFPCGEEIKILDLMGEGNSQKQISDIFRVVSRDYIRQSVGRLRLKLGALNNYQMMFEYGKYKERNKK